MPTPDHDSLPDVAVGRHPDYGIVAANPKQLAASNWMLKGFDFHPVYGHPTLYALANQDRDGIGRTTRAVDMLRKAGYRVDADAVFEPPAPPHDSPPHVEPDVAFAEHPRLGVVAATADAPSALAGRLVLEEYGWRHDPALGIYTLPVAVDRGQALDRVTDATVSLHRSNLQVAVQPHLARDAAARRTAAPSTSATQERVRGAPFRKPLLSTAALAASPARAGLPGKAPTPAPAAPASAVRPVDPRVAFSRNR
ncbi:hypothetical protein [Streptomyces sp. CL12]|uniref:hypothetical protein n=1 Tax=Streptomyces sp. CL12 TaxID=3391744 RepID=UPI003A801432